MKKDQVCIICGRRFMITEGLFVRDLNEELQKAVHDKNDFAKPSSFVCLNDLQKIRLADMQDVITKDMATDQKINAKLTKEMASNNYRIRNINDAVTGQLTRGQRLADAVAKFGGSWAFIIAFIAVLVVWMGLNVFQLFGLHFDPYPFILLNLFLSCVAAIQAPIIMMSQNRQAERDRIDSENDYHTNMKSEMEIRLLHEKIDQLSQTQWQHLLDIQKQQIGVLGELENEIQSLKGNQTANQAARYTRHRHQKNQE